MRPSQGVGTGWRWRDLLVRTIGLLAVALELFQHFRHFRCREQHRFAQLAGAPVLLAQAFQLDAQVQGLLQVAARHQHPVIGQQAGGAPLQGRQGRIGEGLGTEQGIGAAAHRGAAEAGDHVMEGGNLPAQAGQAHGEGGVGVQHRPHLGTGGVQVPVKTPFGRGPAPSPGFTLQAHPGNVGALQAGVVHARGGDQEACSRSDAEIPGRALIEPGASHGPGRGDQLGPQFIHGPAPGTGPAGRRCWPGNGPVR